MAVAQFAAVGVVALVIVAVATSIASRRVGEREAIADARITTLIRAIGVVEPVVDEGLLRGEPQSIAAFDRVVRSKVLDASLVRVKLWSATGRVLYSDEPQLIGREFPLEAEQVEALGTGRIEAEVSHLTAAENPYERPLGKLLEVYLPIHAPSGAPLLFEAYYRYSLVEANGSQLWRSFAPIALGALVLLEVVQIPLAWSLARRLRDRLREREALVRRALDSSEEERRRIARDLHDGVVQDLAGVAYSLAAHVRQGTPVPADALAGAEATVRTGIGALRTLLVDLYPPDLEEVGLPSALSDLLARAEDAGIRTSLDASGYTDPVPIHLQQVLHRVAQEAVRNAVRHSGASSVTVTIATQERCVRLVVVDNGRGLDTTEPEVGHLGIQSMRDLVEDAGGALDVSGAPGAGTTVRAEVPLP